MTVYETSDQNHLYLSDVFEELSTIEHTLHTAAVAILEQCDQLTYLIQSQNFDKEALNNAIAIITQNCAFHDVNSQRLRKLDEGLHDFIHTLKAQHIELPTSILPEYRLASGPSRAKDALSQDDVEALLNT